MSRPLPSGDPTRLGPFRLSARLLETPAGIVYLGEDDGGRQVTVAVLTRASAQDAAARDRFRAAILAAVPRTGGPVGQPGPSGPSGPSGSSGPLGSSGSSDPSVAVGAPVVAAQPDGPAPWVATLYRPGYESGAPEEAGAERFLEPVVLRGALRTPWPALRRGPGYEPYWSGGDRGPAARQPEPPAPPQPPQRTERGLVAAILTLAALLGLLAVLMLALFACQPELPQLPPDPPGDSYSPPPTPSQPQPSQPQPTPTSPPPSVSPPTGSPGEPGDPGDPGT